jgi:predicted nucleic-acid-binding Zn-ribbon protein
MQLIQCSKCNSKEVMPRVRIMDRGHFSGDAGNLTAVTYDDPRACVFEGAHKAALFARVCAACGFTELYLDNARELYDAYLKGENS